VLSTHATPGAVPGPLTLAGALTGWTWELIPLLVVGLTAAVYLFGVLRLRRRGDSWSLWRVMAFVGGGLGSFAVATVSALARYDTVLLTTHMIQHMVLAMVSPLFLALGAPITLALRTLPPRPRELLVRLLHSRLAMVLTFPVVTGALFIANPFVLYFTGIYEATLRYGALHDVMHLHFMAVGCLWFWPLLGLDPMPLRPTYPLRLLAVFATLPFHAFLGVAIMGSQQLIAEQWYLGLNRTWGPSPLEDQRMAGGLLWASGDVVGLLVLAVLFRQWVRESEREARRVDRSLDRAERAANVAPVPSPHA
jgi:cytochrome c oxidase assembly factor CtaG